MPSVVLVAKEGIGIFVNWRASSTVPECILYRKLLPGASQCLRVSQVGNDGSIP
jgi:hypothetical protein